MPSDGWLTMKLKSLRVLSQDVSGRQLTQDKSPQQSSCPKGLLSKHCEEANKQLVDSVGKRPDFSTVDMLQQAVASRALVPILVPKRVHQVTFRWRHSNWPGPSWAAGAFTMEISEIPT